MITTKVKEKAYESHDFPKLMKSSSDGCIILAISYNVSRDEYTGTVIDGNFSWGIGTYSETWNGEVFADFMGSVELSNHKND